MSTMTQTHDMALDVTTDHVSIALSVVGEPVPVLYHEHMRFERNASACLVPWTQDFLKNAHITPHNVRRMIVPRGPGSFTGIRLGLAVAQGLSLSCAVQPIGVNLLEFLAHRVRTKQPHLSCFFVLVPLLRGQAIGQLMDKGKNSHPQTLTIADWHHLKDQNIPLFWDRQIPELMSSPGTPLLWDARDLLFYGQGLKHTDLTPLYVRPPSTTQPSTMNHGILS